MIVWENWSERFLRPKRGRGLFGEMEIQRKWGRPWHQRARWAVVRVAARSLAWLLNVPVSIDLDPGEVNRDIWDALNQAADPVAEAEEARRRIHERLAKAQAKANMQKGVKTHSAWAGVRDA